MVNRHQGFGVIKPRILHSQGKMPRYCYIQADIGSHARLKKAAEPGLVKYSSGKSSGAAYVSFPLYITVTFDKPRFYIRGIYRNLTGIHACIVPSLIFIE